MFIWHISIFRKIMDITRYEGMFIVINWREGEDLMFLFISCMLRHFP